MYSQLQGQCFFRLIWTVSTHAIPRHVQSHCRRLVSWSLALIESCASITSILEKFCWALVDRKSWQSLIHVSYGVWWFLIMDHHGTSKCSSTVPLRTMAMGSSSRSHGEFATRTLQVLTVQYRRLVGVKTPQQIATPFVSKGVGQVGGFLLQQASPQPWSPFFGSV